MLSFYVLFRIIFKRYDQLDGVKKKVIKRRTFRFCRKGQPERGRLLCQVDPCCDNYSSGTHVALVLLCSGGKSTLEFVQTPAKMLTPHSRHLEPVCSTITVHVSCFFPPSNWHLSGFHCVHRAAEESEILFLVFLSSFIPILWFRFPFLDRLIL